MGSSGRGEGSKEGRFVIQKSDKLERQLKVKVNKAKGAVDRPSNRTMEK